MGGKSKVLGVSLVVATAVATRILMNNNSTEGEGAIVEMWRVLKDRLGVWAIPAYVALHTLTLALCLPYAVFFEAGASLLFGFVPGVASVFSAKILAASLSFFIGRVVFRSSKRAMGWAESNKYFHIMSKGVEEDGWRFVLLARFSPIPSYVINYALAATKVNFFLDFLLPTVIGCLPMILQNTSIGSLAGAAASSSKSHLSSYLFPALGISSSILISFRVKKYANNITSLSSVETQQQHITESGSKPKGSKSD